MKIAIGGDHFGFPMKSAIIELLADSEHEVTDHGAFSVDPVDFPDVAAEVTAAILNGEAERGILVCGTGVGAAIAANKTPGIRAAVCHDTYCAHQCVEHDDVNLIAMGAWIIGIKVAQEIIDTFLEAEFSTDPDFRRRVQKLHDLEVRSAEELLAKR